MFHFFIDEFRNVDIVVLELLPYHRITIGCPNISVEEYE